MNQTMLSYGIKSVKENPGKDLMLSLEKIIHLWIFDFKNPKSYHLAYLIPSVLLLILFIIGVYKYFSWERHKYLLFFLVYFTLTIFIFFPLLRYQSMMKIALIPFAAEGLVFLLNKFRSPARTNHQ
jgi:hypothetical protein